MPSASHGRSASRPTTLRLRRYGAPGGIPPLPTPRHLGVPPQVARLRGLSRQDLSLPTAGGGRLQAVGISWRVGPQRTPLSLLLKN